MENEVLFPGFSPKAFALLEDLKEHPFADHYQKHKAAIKEAIVRPFHLMRDDLVVHWLIPGDYDMVTEKNVFSRFLKNDFGKGGCNHHLWFSFYRPGFKRLTDLQLAYSLFPDGLNIGVYVAERAQIPMQRVRTLLQEDTNEFIRKVNALLDTGDFKVVLAGKNTRQDISVPIDFLDPEWMTAKEIWIKSFIPRVRVLEEGSQVFNSVLSITEQLDPLYRYLGGGDLS